MVGSERGPLSVASYVPMDLSTLAAMPVPSPIRPSMICFQWEGGREVSWCVRRVAKRSAGFLTQGLDLTRRIWSSRRSGRLRQGQFAWEVTHLLGADEVVAEAASLFLREHHHLDGFLGEALEGWVGGEG
jgi:hypothetical protein